MRKRLFLLNYGLDPVEHAYYQNISSSDKSENI